MSACRRWIVGKSRNTAGTEVMGFCVGDRRIFVAAHHFSNRGAARAFFHGIMHTAGHGQAHAKKCYAYNEKDKDRTHKRKFNGRGPSLVASYVYPKTAHG